MAPGNGSVTIRSVPAGCQIKSLDNSVITPPYTPSGALSFCVFKGNENISYKLTPIIDGIGLPNINLDRFYDLAVTSSEYTSSFKKGNYSCWHIIPGDFDTYIDFVFNESVSIGNIPMGELTFNGVQSVTYNGTDYTKLIVDGTNYPPQIIDFTIGGENYQAEEGMTWDKWIESSYNTKYYSESGGMVFNSAGDPVCYNNNIVSIEAVIIANHAYALGSHSGSTN